jgi:hypothetical protein
MADAQTSVKKCLYCGIYGAHRNLVCGDMAKDKDEHIRELTRALREAAESLHYNHTRRMKSQFLKTVPDFEHCANQMCAHYREALASHGQGDAKLLEGNEVDVLPWGRDE